MLSARAALLLQTTRIDDFRSPASEVKIDPMTLGFGMGVRLGGVR